ncbi:hypothetical protein OG978_32795 [Streptomyces sp. NBC_01591]|uniref:hypothetical protein n=1 Tax=Streptomyces sp. NBC_01591 TaxID=2975888 RepID=UPI002DDC8235|nr:hypothetical protein [Streptomyces sp. NBC_01591]WSD71753.1 hypothetical protein OG978_32795 [Streptomyces sp. NBC_01591]
MPLQVGPCDPWPVDLCCQLPEDLDQAVIDRWTRVASQTLWRLSGMRWGPCPVTVRPCRRACADSSPISFQAGAGTGPWVPYIGEDGQWRNASVCGCPSSDCSCGELCEVYLPGPVYDVVEVNEGGQILVPGIEYRVDAPGKLVRLGGQCWMSCQDMAAPEGAPNTLTVTYRWGLPLDDAAIAAVSELTCQLILACLPPGTRGCGECRLPGNVTRVVRRGVEIEMADPTLIFTEGRTGLPLTDLWIRTVNPGGLTSPSRVYSPDFRRPRITTWP